MHLFASSHLSLSPGTSPLMENSPEPTREEALVGKIRELLTESDSETAQFCFEEETIEEVMQQFYNELAGSLVNPPKQPSPPPPPHATDAGNNGSCGASVSDSKSTVMAGIELVGSGGSLPAGKAKMEAEGETDELDDEWLGRVLSWEQGQPVENKLWF